MEEYLRLDQVCELNMGQSPDSNSYNENGDGLPFFQGNADFGEEYPTVRVWCNAPTKIVEPNTLLISVRAPIGALNFAKDKSCIGRGLAGINPKDNYDLKYIYYCLKAKHVELNGKGTGSTFKAISKNALGETQVKKITLQEQNECVESLNKVARIIKYRHQQLEELDTLIKSRFVEMFGDPVSNPYGWDEIQLGECLESIENGKSFICANESRKENWPAVLKLSAVTYGYYIPDENKAMLDEAQFVKNAEVRMGDLLFTRKNTPELVGMTAYVADTPIKLMMPDLIFRLNTKEHCNKVFLWQLINHELFRKRIQGLASGTAKSMSNISKERLKKLQMYLPSIELQQQFADFVHQVDKSKFVLGCIGYVP